MADITTAAPPQLNNVVRRWVDMADGTWAELGVGVQRLGSVSKATAGPPATDQTVRSFNPATDAGTPLSTTLTTTVSTGYTVPTGKNLYLTDIYASGNSANQFTVNIAGGAFRGIAKGDTAPIQLSGIESINPVAGGTAVTFVFGVVATATNVFYQVSGFDQ